MALTAKQSCFVEEYLIDLNATQAAVRAGYSPKRADAIGYENLRKPEIQKIIEERMKERSKRTKIDADEVLRELYAIAMADANGIVSFRRECCRYCWGVNHAYQFKTKRELDAAQREFEGNLSRAKKAKLPKAAQPTFDASGGIGFNPKREPNLDCPECNGEGYGRVFIVDTRKLTPELRALYGGVKQTKDGLEVRINSKDKAIELSMRHLGLLNDKMNLNAKIVSSVETYVMQLPDNFRDNNAGN